MIIEHVKVTGLGPIRKPFEATFVRDNCVVGRNGCGKTTLFAAIAGVAGTDAATMLVENQEVDHFCLVAREGSEKFVFETSGRFDPRDIERFKASLPERVSFPVTEWDTNFIGRCIDPAEGRKLFSRFISCHTGRNFNREEMFFYSPRDRSVRFLSGDGYTHAFWLLLNDSPDGVPILLDNPSRHLDLQGKRMMIEWLSDKDRQLIYTTHCPEMVLHEGWKGTNKQQKVIEIPML